MATLNWDILEDRCRIPYSDKKEICLVLGSTGLYYPGVRVENISFPLSVEAVQAAIFACLSEGDTPVELILPESGYPDEHPDNPDMSHGNLNDCLDPDDKAANLYSNTGSTIPYWCRQFDLQCKIYKDLEMLNPAPVFKTKEEKIDMSRLQQLIERCVIPYSSFPVAAMLITDNGIYSGVNIEMADWQKGLCAERVAIAKALACGARSLREIHIHAPESDYVSPCGACRQVMMEQMGDGAMLMHHNAAERSRLSVVDLLPYQFKAGRLSRSKS